MNKILIGLLLFISQISFAGEKTGNDKEFNVTEMIMHHISDAHEFHVAGDFSIPLPIILWTEKGLVLFMSSEFHHNDDGTVVVERNGQKFVKFHEKIYYANAQGTVNLDKEKHPTNEKPLDFSITKNVFSMLLSVVLLFILLSKTGKFYKRNGAVAPKGIASFLEPLVLFVRDDIARSNIGSKADRFMPYLLTIFFFIWINNLIGLIPVFPFSANLTGNIAFTFVLSFITFIITTLSANKHYWQHIFATPGLPKVLLIIMIPVEVLGMFTKPFALTLRLFANITAGHIIILSLISVIFITQNIGWAGLSVPFVLFMNVLELLVAFLQAYIFTLLSALFIGQATEGHHH